MAAYMWILTGEDTAPRLRTHRGLGEHVGEARSHGSKPI